jgi:hypothetical protein
MQQVSRSDAWMVHGGVASLALQAGKQVGYASYKRTPAPDKGRRLLLGSIPVAEIIYS